MSHIETRFCTFLEFSSRALPCKPQQPCWGMHAGVLKPTHRWSKWLSKTKLMMLQNDKLLRVIDLRDPQRTVHAEDVEARILMATSLTCKEEGPLGKTGQPVLISRCCSLSVALGQGLAKYSVTTETQVVSPEPYGNNGDLFRKSKVCHFSLLLQNCFLITSPLPPLHCLVTINYRNKWQG